MRYSHMNARRDGYRQRAQELMLPALLEAAKDCGNEIHMHEVVEQIEVIVQGMLADGRRDTAFDALKAMLLHHNDYLRGIAARAMILLNEPALDGALADALKKGDGYVLNALACGLREKITLEVVREGGQDSRTPEDREFDAASFSLMERFRKRRVVSSKDLRGIEAGLLEDAENDGEASAKDRLMLRRNILLLERELCAPCAAGGGLQRRSGAGRGGHAPPGCKNVVRLRAAKPEDAWRIPR